MSILLCCILNFKINIPALYPKTIPWPWLLFLSIFLYQAIPAIYNSYSIYLIGNAVPGVNGLAIASQWQTVQLIVEIVQESLVFPIYFFVGSKLLESDREVLSSRVAVSMKAIVLVLVPLMVLLYSQTGRLVELTNTPVEIANETISYLRLRVLALFFSITNLGLVIIAESLNKKGLIFRIVVVKALLFVALDSLFYGGYSFSLGLGINGVAWSNLLVEGILFALIVYRFRVSLGLDVFKNFFNFQLKDFAVFREVSAWLALESLVRNVAYLVMIVSLINALGSQQIGGYYLSMHLFWSFLLLPILTVVEVVRVRAANLSKDIENVRNLLHHALQIGLVFLLVWVIILPFISALFMWFNPDLGIVEFAKQSFLILFAPYCLLSLNMIMDGVFYGLGKTKYLAFQSLTVNLSIYLAAYLAYKIGHWQPDFTSILILFTTGILLDSVLTWMYWRKLYRENHHE